MNIILLVTFLTSVMPILSQADELTLMTWNVYYDDDSGKTRYPNIMEMIGRENTDVVCLQEVTPTFVTLLHNSRLLEKYQFVSEDLRQRYGNVILYKKKLQKKDSVVTDLPSRMGRKGLLLTLAQQEKHITFVNVHLESMMDDGPIRRKQLSKIKKSVALDELVVLCGDFNFGDDELDDSVLGENYHDVGKGSSKVTYDVDENRLAKKTEFFFEKSRRLDRVYIKGNIQIDGYKVVSVKHSDHYPVIMQLRTGSQRTR